MAGALDGLDPAFVSKLSDLLADLKAKGYALVPYFGVRTPQDQAKLWRQSRFGAEIAQKVADLRKIGANFLADCIEHAPSTTGKWATNAIPGLSWHQFGRACDCVWVEDGKQIWGVDQPAQHGGMNGYKFYTQLAPAHGLTPLGPMIGDWDHVQLDKESSPAHAYSLLQIDTLMRGKFS